MKYIIEENLKKLKFLLGHYQKPLNNYQNPDTEDAEKLWNASLFFANLLIASDYSGPDISDKELRDFTTDYEIQNKVTIDLEALFSKFWLRNIFGNIYIPDVIRQTAREYEKEKDRYNELLFIRHLKIKLEIDEASSEELKKQIKSYESNQKLKLDSEWLLNSHYIKEKKDSSNFEVSSVDNYTKLLDNWAIFKFINEVLKYKQKKYDASISITKNRFQKIYKQQKALFFKTPVIEEILENKVLVETSEGYNISIRSGKPNYILDLAGRIKAAIWQKILDDDSFENDTLRVLKYLSYSKFDGHRNDIGLHLSEEAKERFRETALKMVLGAPDLLSIDQEFNKVFLEDNISFKNYWNSKYKNKSDDLQPTDDIYDLYENMLKVSDSYNGNLFFMQDCRSDLSYLLDELLLLDKEYYRNDHSDNFKYSHYPFTKRLLSEGLAKPYLLWQSAHFLKTRGLTRLPYFLIEENLATLTFRLLDDATIEVLPNETVSQVRTKMLKIAIPLIFDEITSTSNYDKEKFANIIFQIFKEINRNKFQLVQNSRTIEIYEETISDKKERENILLKTIENYSLDINSFPKKASPSVVSKHLSLLLKRVHSYTTTKKLSNGSWHLPLHKLDYLSWLSKVAINCQLKKEELESNIHQEIAKIFLETYQSAIEKVSITKTDYPSLELKASIPSWYLDNEHLDNINWFYPFILLKQNNIISTFLNPSINFNLDEDIYDDLNQYSTKRLRSHLFILLSTLLFINNRNSNLFRLQKETNSIKKKLEATILDILNNNAVQHKRNKIDILDEFFERGFKSSNKSELIPQIANSINWFTDKKGIIAVLAKTSDLIRLLIILDWITAEGLKKELIKKIKKSKITEFIKSRRFNPEMELLITKLTYQPKLIKQTKEALDYWNKNVTTHGKNDLEKATYLVDLMLAYNDKDEKALDEIKIPESKSYKVQKEFEAGNYKQFFRGLIRFSTNPESAYQIFDNLHHQFPDHSTIALNRFAAKINWASKTKTNILFEEALDEWKQMKTSLSETYLENIKDSIWTNELTVYYHLDNKVEFDKLYLSIPYPYQMKEDMVELKIGMLLKNQLREDAKKVLFGATNYHEDSVGRIPKFIRNLKTKLDDETDIKFLQNNFNEIFASQPKNLIQIFPDRLNPENELGSFLTWEVALANSKMLDKINAVRDVGLEDKFNDLVQLALDARVAQWGWQVKDQARGGFSANNKKYNPGERDIIVCDSNSDALIVCEAFIWKDRPTAESHIKKIFNYHHRRKDFIILIYDRRQYKNFDSSWKRYKEAVLPDISYPENFDLIKDKWKELTKRFGYNSTGIKVGSSKHGKSTRIFHIMVNLNYRVQ